MEQQKDYDYIFKILLLGDISVGKTSLLFRICDNSFGMPIIYSIGMDFRIKTLCVDDKKIKLQLWDRSGPEVFRRITPSYFRRTHGIIIAYDVTNRSSFANIKNWLREIEEFSSGNIAKIIIGNKCDLSKTQEVPTDEAKEFADSVNISFIETSAKSGQNVIETFEILTQLIQANILTNENSAPADSSSRGSRISPTSSIQPSHSTCYQ